MATIIKNGVTSIKANDQLEPTVFVIFGGAGDLTWRKLVPALFDLSQDRSLPPQYAIIVVDRIELGDAALRRRLHDGVNQFSVSESPRPPPGISLRLTSITSRAILRSCKLIRFSVNNVRSSKKNGELKPIVSSTWPRRRACLARSQNISAATGLARDREWSRIVIEKPIGYDLESARALNAILAASFNESQIFRIDHYLGKETVQNILAFRFANPVFEPLWNRRYIDYVTITVAETVGVEHRGGYYEHAGALRDMVQII